MRFETSSSSATSTSFPSTRLRRPACAGSAESRWSSVSSDRRTDLRSPPRRSSYPAKPTTRTVSFASPVQRLPSSFRPLRHFDQSIIDANGLLHSSPWLISDESSLPIIISTHAHLHKASSLFIYTDPFAPSSQYEDFIIRITAFSLLAFRFHHLGKNHLLDQWTVSWLAGRLLSRR